jgi:hypothetical protein
MQLTHKNTRFSSSLKPDQHSASPQIQPLGKDVPGGGDETSEFWGSTLNEGQGKPRPKGKGRITQSLG